MAIGTYAELQTAVANFVHRTDISADIPDLIARAEGKLNLQLRLTQQEQRTTLTLQSGYDYVALPSKFLEDMPPHFIDLGGGTLQKLEPFPDAWVKHDRSTSDTGAPSYYRIGANMEFDIVADQEYTIYFHWYKGWDIATTLTNWLLTNYPSIYMDAIMLEIGLFTRDSAMVAIADGQVKEWIAQLKSADSRLQKNELVAVDPALLGASRFDINRG